MKILVFPTLLLIIATAAIGYLTYSIAHSHSDPNEVFVGIGTGLSVLLTLGCVISVSLKNHRMNVNMKAWSGVAFVVMVITNLCFAGFGITMPYYVIVITLLLVVHLWMIYELVIECNDNI